MAPAPAPVAALLAARARAQRRALLGAIAAAIVAAVAGTVLLGLSGWFLTGAAIAGAAGGAAVGAFNYLVPSAFIRLSAIARTAGRYGERLLSHRAALRALAGLRVDLMAGLAHADPRTTRPLSRGDSAARLTADVDALEDRVVRTPATPAALAAAAVALLLVALAAPAALIPVIVTLLALPRLAAAMASARVDAPTAEAQKQLAWLKAALGDLSAAGPELAVYGLTGTAVTQLQQVAARMDAARRQAARGGALANALLPVAGAALAGLILLLASGPPPLVAGAMLAVLAATEALAGPVRARMEEARTAQGLQQLEALAADAGVPPPSRPTTAPATAPTPAPSLDIAGVALAPGARLALIGRSGSGKTRILETLAGLRADAPEPLQVNGACPRTLAFETLADCFALAPQDPVLIAGSIADNLRLARPGLDDQALWGALAVACLADEVRALPEGLLTWLGDGGQRLSGGQRKRLALARALLAGRPWLLLDEPSEGLDAATEARLAAALDSWLLSTGTGAILASHRPALAALAPRQLTLSPVAP